MFKFGVAVLRCNDILQVVPLLNAANMDRSNLLVGLVRADVPSDWYGLPIVKAIILVQWRKLVQVGSAAGTS